MIIYFFGKR